MREWKTWHQVTGVENAGVENMAPDDRGGKCESGKRAPGDRGGKRGSRRHRSVRAVQDFIQELICGGCKSQGGGRRAKVG